MLSVGKTRIARPVTCTYSETAGSPSPLIATLCYVTSLTISAVYRRETYGQHSLHQLVTAARSTAAFSLIAIHQYMWENLQK